MNQKIKHQVNKQQASQVNKQQRTFRKLVRVTNTILALHLSNSSNWNYTCLSNQSNGIESHYLLNNNYDYCSVAYCSYINI